MKKKTIKQKKRGVQLVYTQIFKQRRDGYERSIGKMYEIQKVNEYELFYEVVINVNKKKIFKSLYFLLVFVGLIFGVLYVVKYKDGLSFLYFFMLCVTLRKTYFILFKKKQDDKQLYVHFLINKDLNSGKSFNEGGGTSEKFRELIRN